MKAILIALGVFVAQLLATSSFANCYVLQNSSTANVQFSFQYNMPVMPPFDTDATVFPGHQYPLTGQQWCITYPGMRVSVFVNGGSPSWNGTLVLGDSGGDIRPSGTYVVK